MGNVTAIPEGKGTPEEREEYEAFRSGADNLYHEGITNIPEPYDQYAGSQYEKTQRPDVTPTPTFATDPGQPKINANVTARQSAVDKSERTVVSSSGRGRKAKTATAGDANGENA